MFGWDRALQMITPLQNRWGGKIETASRVTSVDAHLPFPHEVILSHNPHRLHRDRVSLVCP